MTNPHTPEAPDGADRRPTRKQMATLQRLAVSRGQSFAYPKTVAEASAEIQRLIAARPLSRYDQRRERDIAHQVGAGRSSAASVRDDEIVGYGSTATWSQVA